MEVSEHDDPDAWRAARVSLGALGVVTELTLQATPAFTLEGVDAPRPLDDVLDRLDELADGNDHFELYNFPHSDLALTRTNNRVDAPPRPRSRARAWTEDVLLTNGAFGLACRIGRARPALIPRLNRTCRAWRAPAGAWTGRSRSSPRPAGFASPKWSTASRARTRARRSRRCAA